MVGETKYSPKSGKHFEYLGSYNPKTKHTIIDAEKVKGWLAKGAQASATVHNLFITKGIISGSKINVLKTFKAPEVKEEQKAEAPVEVPKVEAPPEPAPEESKAE